MALVEIIFEGTDKASDDIKDVNKALGETEDAGKRGAKGVNTFGDTLKAILTAGIIKKVFQGIVDFGKQIVSAAAEEEVAFAGLQVAIENSGASYEEAEGKINAYIKAQMATTTYGEEEQVKSIQALTEITGDYNEAMDLSTLAQDLAAAKGMDLVTASELVGKVAKGNTSMLARYGIVIDKDADATQALATLTQKFGGQAEKMGKTAAGSMKRFSNQMGELKDTLGTALLPTIGKVSGKLATFLSDNMPKIAALATRVGDWLAGAFEKVWDWIGKAWEVGKNFVDVIGNVFSAFQEGDVGLAIDEFFEGFYKQLSDMGINVPAAKLLVQQLVDEFKWIPAGISQIFTDGKNVVSLAFQLMMGGDVWEDTPSVVDGITGKITAGKTGLKSALLQLGADMQAYIIKGLTSFANFAFNFSEMVLAWTKDPTVQASLSGFGTGIGSSIGDAIKLAFTSNDNTKKVSDGVVEMLAMAVTNMAASLVTVGGLIAAGIVQGILQSFAPGDASGVGDTLRLFSTNLISAIFGGYRGGLMGLLSESMNELMRGLDMLKNPTKLANGFNGIVTAPRLFMAGEAGPERVQVTPMGKAGGGSGGNILNFNFYGSPQRNADAVMTKLRAAGMA